MTTVNVVVGRKKNIQVSANATGGSVSTNRNNVTLKSGVAPTTRLDSLNDVVATGEITGAVPVYDSTTDKYVVQKLDFNNVTGDLDGGTF
jgi:hypothetical protein